MLFINRFFIIVGRKYYHNYPEKYSELSLEIIRLKFFI